MGCAKDTAERRRVASADRACAACASARGEPLNSERPYWLLALLAALLVAPPVWAAATLIAIAAGLTVASAIRGSRILRQLARTDASSARKDLVGVLLGSDERGKPVVISDEELSAHGLILGASGAGKSTTLLTILTDRIVRGRPVVAIDLKGSTSFERELHAAARTAGRRLRVWTLDGEERWNPLEHGNATELKDKLIGAERFTEPHYQRAAERYLQLAIQALHDAHPGRPVELEDVVRLMEPTRLAGLLGSLERTRAEQIQDYLASLTADQHSAIRGLGTRLAILSESHAGAFLSSRDRLEPGIDLRRALNGEEIVLFSLNSSRYAKLAAQVGTLVVQDLVAASGARLSAAEGGHAPQATVAIDEFSALAADHVVALLARGRASGTSVLLATQELADLDRAATGFRDQVMGVSAFKVAHRQDVPSSAQTVAQLAGTEKVWEETRQIGGGLGHRGYGRGTRRLVEQFVVHPNDIKSLQTGRAVLITKLPSARTRIVNVRPPARSR